jgi:transcriptional regulator
MKPTLSRKMKSEPRDLFPGALEIMVLQTLDWQPMHGYALVQHIQQRSRDLLQVEEGSLYPALQRMLKAGLVEAEWTISPTNRRVRTYRITAKGSRHLEQEVSRFEQMLEGISLVLAPIKT